RRVTLDAACAAHAYSCLGGRDFLRMVFALVHVEANLLVGDAGSRHVLTASSLRIDQPSYFPADAAPPVVRRLRRLRRLRLLTTGQNQRQRPAKLIVAAQTGAANIAAVCFRTR
ncbi:hypothetical protein M3A49_42025, partial [Paraburkholderia sp. CNPSo 3076]|uniref:hypothetical protein n=1 Tax=Paraburkholderia sp. CNPSo 3076 TaxID=2940936 RepID=UPI00225586A0